MTNLPDKPGNAAVAAFLQKVAAARDGLSHALPGATTEQVLEAALDLLLEKQAREKALVRRPRTGTEPRPSGAGRAAKAGAPTSAPTRGATSASDPSPASTPDRTPVRPSPRSIPAAVEREVRLRDGGRCQFPLDAGGICGSTLRVQLDHILPVALGGPSSTANLRCTCAFPEVSPRIGTEGGGRSIG